MSNNEIFDKDLSARENFDQGDYTLTSTSMEFTGVDADVLIDNAWQTYDNVWHIYFNGEALDFKIDQHLYDCIKITIEGANCISTAAAIIQFVTEHRPPAVKRSHTFTEEEDVPGIGVSALAALAHSTAKVSDYVQGEPQEVVELVCIDAFDQRFTKSRAINTTIRVNGKAWAGTMHTVTVDKLWGLLPSKALHLPGKLLMTFYYNNTLPEASRVLKNSAAHILVIPQAPGDSFEYNKEAGVYIDNQVHSDGYLLNIVVFGGDQLKLLEV